MQNLNPYNKELFEKSFKETETYRNLCKITNNISFDKHFHQRRFGTPRQSLLESHISAVPWYYLEYLDTSKPIYDLGCGMNFFKPYFPNLIGVDYNASDSTFFADIDDVVDDNFYNKNINTYDSVFSINALHFHPLDEIRDICIKFSNMLKPGGKGFLALNAIRMVEKSQTLSGLYGSKLDSWIRTQFVDFPNEILVFDIDVSVLDAWLDGNIRIVFSKK